VVDDWSVVDDWGSSVDSWGGLRDDGVESVDVISGVVNGSDRAIGFNERVLSLDDTSVTDFALGLDVSGQTVLDSVVERVFWVRVSISMMVIVMVIVMVGNVGSWHESSGGKSENGEAHD
jgi:hypothetical protein